MNISASWYIDVPLLQYKNKSWLFARNQGSLAEEYFHISRGNEEAVWRVSKRLFPKSDIYVSHEIPARNRK